MDVQKSQTNNVSFQGGGTSYCSVRLGICLYPYIDDPNRSHLDQHGSENKKNTTEQGVSHSMSSEISTDLEKDTP